MAWNPGQYLKFGDKRLRPGLELLDRITFPDKIGGPALIYDLGAGTGALTAALAARWPAARVIGIDSSPEMLARAKTDFPAIDWRQADIRCWAPDPLPDLIYSNATLHWIDDHAVLYPRLFGYLEPGGILAVQLPGNFDQPSHQLMNETAADGPWADDLAQTRWRQPVLPTARYYELLAPRAAEIDLWETTYTQVLEGPDPVLEWVRGSGFTPFLEAVQPDRRAAFEAEYARRLRAAYPPRADGKTLFPFRRIFLVARAFGARVVDR